MIISLHQLITDKHLRWGFPKCFCRIRKLGYKWNHKRLGLLSIKTQYSLNEINDYPNVFQNHYQITWSKHRLHLNLSILIKTAIERFNLTYRTEVLNLYL